MNDRLDVLLAETRARREALHALIGRLRRDHASWRDAAARLPSRTRLTAPQREMFQRYLRRRSHDA